MLSFQKKETGVDFNTLHPYTREKLCHYLSPTNAVLFKPHKLGVAWRIAALVFAALWLNYCWRDGFGIIGHEQAIQSYSTLHWYLIPFCLMAYLVWRLYDNYFTTATLPWGAGIYMTMTDVIDARSRILKIHPSTSMDNAYVDHQYDGNGKYTNSNLFINFLDGTREVFSSDNPDELQEALNFWTVNKVMIEEAEKSGDSEGLEQLDPFSIERKSHWFYNSQTNPDSSSNDSPLVKPLPSHVRFSRALVIPTILVVALTCWISRNNASDQALLEKLHGFSSVENWEWYINSGGKQSEKAKSEWLPETALKIATTRDRSMVAIVNFESKFPGPQYKEYRDRANIEIAEAALDSAATRESVTALKQFKEEFSRDSHADVRAKAQAHIHELYMQAHEEFIKQASKRDNRVVPFFRKLLTWLAENNSVNVQVSFKGPGQAEVTRIDEAAKQSHGEEYVRYDNNQSIPIIPLTRHYNPDHSENREQVILGLLKESFQAIFPQDILVPNITDHVDEAHTPSLQVEYTIKPMKYDSGEVVIYIDPDEPKGVGHIGFRFLFSIKMQVPGSNKNFDFPVGLKPPEKFTVFGTTSMELPDIEKLTFDQRVYDTMAEKAFESFATEMQKALFKEGSDGFEAARLPERRLLRRVLVDLAAMQDGESSNAEMAMEVFSDMTGDIFSKPAFVDSVNEARKRKEDESPKFSLEDLTNNLTNKNTKTMVVRGAARFAILTGGETNEQENRYISDLMELLDVTTNDLEEKNSPPDDN